MNRIKCLSNGKIYWKVRIHPIVKKNVSARIFRVCGSLSTYNHSQSLTKTSISLEVRSDRLIFYTLKNLHFRWNDKGTEENREFLRVNKDHDVNSSKPLSYTNVYTHTGTQTPTAKSVRRSL